MYNTGNKPVNLFKTPDDEDFVNKVSFEKKDKINYNKPFKKNNLKNIYIYHYHLIDGRNIANRKSANTMHKMWTLF